MEVIRRGDRVVVEVRAAPGTWRVEIDLESGEVHRGPRREPMPAVASSALAALRAEALATHAEGDLRIHEQFADGEVEVAITLAGRTVTLLYITAGAPTIDRAPSIYALACAIVRK